MAWESESMCSANEIAQSREPETEQDKAPAGRAPSG